MLIGKTRDENRHVRGKAAEALGRIGDERALKALRNAQKDEFVFVKDKAEIAIHKILRKHETTRIFNFDNGEVSFDYSDHWEIISTSDAKKVVRDYMKTIPLLYHLIGTPMRLKYHHTNLQRC